MNPLEILQENKLMETAEAVTAFEDALAELAENFRQEELPQYHLVLDDRCQHPEVMFGLIHFLESFEIEQQLAAFLEVTPQLILIAPEWMRILHSRILNDQDYRHFSMSSTIFSS